MIKAIFFLTPEDGETDCVSTMAQLSVRQSRITRDDVLLCSEGDSEHMMRTSC